MGGRTSLRLTRRGTGVLAVGVVVLAGGLVAAYPGAVALGTALLVLLGLSVASVLVPVPVTVARAVEPRTVPRLAACEVVVRLRNDSRRAPVTLTGIDHVAGEDRPLGVARLRPGERAELRTPVPTTRRGQFRLGPLRLVRQGFAGLVGTTQEHGRATTVTVVPRVLDVAAPPPGVRRGHIGADERVEHGGTDLVGIREYVPGDDLRRLHWATSARTGTLMVREDADPSQPHLTVLLDDRPGTHDGDGFEEAVDLAVSLVTGAVRSGSPARLTTWSGAVDTEVGAAVPGDAGPLRALESLVQRTATLGPTAPSTTSTTAGPVPLLGRRADVLVTVTGAAVDPADVLLHTAGAPRSVLLVVDPAPARVVGAAGAAVVLRGPRAEDVAAAWAQAVAR